MRRLFRKELESFVQIRRHYFVNFNEGLALLAENDITSPHKGVMRSVEVRRNLR